MVSLRANAQATAARRIRSMSARLRASVAFISRLVSILNTKLAFAKLYDRKTALVAADLLNDRVIPFVDEQHIPLCRMLTDRGTEYCGAPERHEYELYLAVENIDHTRTQVRSRRTNGIAERFHPTEFTGMQAPRAKRNSAFAHGNR